MARAVNALDREAWRPLHHISIGHESIGLRERLGQTRHAEISTLGIHILVQTEIMLIHDDLAVGLLLQLLPPLDMVEMAMSDQHPALRRYMVRQEISQIDRNKGCTSRKCVSTAPLPFESQSVRFEPG